MNTLRKLPTRECNRSDAGSESYVTRRRSVLPAVAIEYDDGNPATVAPMAGASEKGSGLRPCILPGCDAGSGAGRRSELAMIAREAIVEYDDGDPATIMP